MFSHAGAWRERVLAAEMNMQGLWYGQWCSRVCGAMAEWGKYLSTPGHLSNTDSRCSSESSIYRQALQSLFLLRCFTPPSVPIPRILVTILVRQPSRSPNLRE
jgi:hypothetical protein